MLNVGIIPFEHANSNIIHFIFLHLCLIFEPFFVCINDNSLFAHYLTPRLIVRSPSSSSIKNALPTTFFLVAIIIVYSVFQYACFHRQHE